MKEKNPIRIIRCRKTVAMYLAAAALVCVLFASPLPAQFAVRPVNLAYLSQRADVIIQGQITSVKHKSSCRISEHSHSRSYVECREIAARASWQDVYFPRSISGPPVERRKTGLQDRAEALSVPALAVAVWAEQPHRHRSGPFPHCRLIPQAAQSWPTSTGMQDCSGTSKEMPSGRENNSRRISGNLLRPNAVRCRWKNLFLWLRA